MKKMILFLLLVLSQAAFGQWEECYKSTTSLIYSSGTEIYAGVWVNSPQLVLSKDYGESWTPINNDLNFMSMESILKKDNYLFVGTNLGVFLSTNYGKSWTPKREGLLSGGSDGVVSMINYNNRLFASVFHAGIFRSFDNGDSWKACNYGLLSDYITSFALCDKYLFAGSWHEGIYVSTDYGSSWKQSIKIGYAMYIMAMATVGNQVFAGTSEGVLRTTDNGQNWEKKNNGLMSDIFRITSSNNNIFVTIDGHGVYLSTNNGDNWIPINEGLTTKRVYQLAICGNYIFVTSDKGIFRAKIADLIYAADVKENLQLGQSMEIQPNPATENITISLNNGLQPIVSNGSLSIYNSLGIEIKRFTENELAGQNYITFSTEALSSGIYYCTYTSGTESITKSFIVIK